MTLSSRVRLIGLTGALMMVVASSTILLQAPAYALSDIKDITPTQPDAAAGEEPSAEPEDEGVTTDDSFPVIPDPDPLIKQDETEQAAPAERPDEPAAEVIYDIEKAPKPVRRMRKLIMDAALTGDISKLRPLLNPGPDQTQVPLQTRIRIQ